MQRCHTVADMNDNISPTYGHIPPMGLEDHITLTAPSVTLTSTSPGAPSSITTWRADLELLLADGEACGAAPVHAGFADFTVVRLMDQPVAELLATFGSNAVQVYAELFEDNDLGPELADAFDEPVHTVLLIESVRLADLVRGQALGAWMLSEIIARMAGAIDTLALLNPFLAIERTGETDELAAVTVLTEHWAKTGLAPVPGAPMFLGASTAYAELGEAHRRLADVADCARVHVPAQLFTETRLDFDLQTATGRR